jgi:ATP-binding cassette subfamily B (MDR/TAP) protein 1
VSTLEYSNFQFFVGLMVRGLQFEILYSEDDFTPQSSVFGAIQAGYVFAYVPDISSAKSAGSDVIKLLDLRPEIDAESTEGDKVPTEMVRGQIRLENIHFQYMCVALPSDDCDFVT